MKEVLASPAVRISAPVVLGVSRNRRLTYHSTAPTPANISHGIEIGTSRARLRCTPGSCQSASAGSETLMTKALIVWCALSGTRRDARSAAPRARQKHRRMTLLMAAPSVGVAPRGGFPPCLGLIVVSAYFLRPRRAGPKPRAGAAQRGAERAEGRAKRRRAP